MDNTLKTAAAYAPKRRKKGADAFHKNVGGWLLMLPSLLLFGFFIWYPILSNLVLSFFETSGIIRREQFVLFANFKSVFADPLFLSALKNTVLYVLYSLLIGFALPIVLAVVLNEVVHFKTAFKVGIYLPNVVPGMAAAIMWMLVLDNSGSGLLNSFLGSFGLGPFNYLGNRATVIPMIIVTMTWRGAGATALIYFAALQGIDSTYYEAARIDGAGALKRLWHVTLPQISGMLKLMLVLQIISVFQIFYEPRVMVGDDPSAVSLMQLSYKYAFSEFNGGKSAALGILIAAFLLMLSAVYNKLTGSED